MIITYQRLDSLDRQQIDAAAQQADLSPAGAKCGSTTNNVGGVEWRCTRAPHLAKTNTVPRMTETATAPTVLSELHGPTSTRLRTKATASLTPYRATASRSPCNSRPAPPRASTAIRSCR